MWTGKERNGVATVGDFTVLVFGQERARRQKAEGWSGGGGGVGGGDGRRGLRGEGRI